MSSSAADGMWGIPNWDKRIPGEKHLTQNPYEVPVPRMVVIEDELTQKAWESPIEPYQKLERVIYPWQQAHFGPYDPDDDVQFNLMWAGDIPVPSSTPAIRVGQPVYAQDTLTSIGLAHCPVVRLLAVRRARGNDPYAALDDDFEHNTWSSLLDQDDDGDDANSSDSSENNSPQQAPRRRRGLPKVTPIGILRVPGLYEGKDAEDKWWPITLLDVVGDPMANRWKAKVHDNTTNGRVWPIVVPQYIRTTVNAKQALRQYRLRMKEQQEDGLRAQSGADQLGGEQHAPQQQPSPGDRVSPDERGKGRPEEKTKEEQQEATAEPDAKRQRGEAETLTVCP